MRIAIFTDAAGWHGRELKRAAKMRGVEVRYVSLSDCYFDLSLRRSLFIPGFESHLPDAAFVRAIPAGSFEQVTLRLSLLHALRELGVTIYNDARSIEKSVDKAMTSFLLHHRGIATPLTWVTEQSTTARRIMLKATASGQELVLKPLFGAQGEGLARLSAGMTLPNLESYQGVAYLQRFVDAKQKDWHDWRVFVVGGQAIAAMQRHGKSWINNVAQGARCEPAALDSELASLAERASHALDMDYAGVDLMRDHEGKACVIEVNGIPAWKGLQSVTDVSIARCLINDLLDRRLARQQRAKV
ncbi:MAG: RimK family alpha-L-glutamate ligase [Burkholderiales bacterium]